MGLRHGRRESRKNENGRAFGRITTTGVLVGTLMLAGNAVAADKPAKKAKDEYILSDVAVSGKFVKCLEKGMTTCTFTVKKGTKIFGIRPLVEKEGATKLSELKVKAVDDKGVVFDHNIKSEDCSGFVQEGEEPRINFDGTSRNLQNILVNIKVTAEKTGKPGEAKLTITRTCTCE